MSGRTVVILRGMCGLLCLAVALVLAAPAIAQTLTVTNTLDHGVGSLRDTIGGSTSGDTIAFDPSLNGQTITLTTGALIISHGLTIEGPGAASLTISGNAHDTVFDIVANTTSDDVTISAVTITDGAISGQGTLGGGAIFADSVHSLTLNGDAITHNTATISSARSGGGGAVYVNGAPLTVGNSTITNNTATITNPASGSNGGGGIYVNGGSGVEVDGSVVSDNTVSDGGGSNSVDDGGGGIYSNGAPLTLANTSVNDNSVQINSTESDSGGGGIYVDGGTIEINAGSVNGNSLTIGASTLGENGGGGIYSNGGSTSIGIASVDGNSATVTDSSTVGKNGGGAVFNQAGGGLGVAESSVSQNSADVTATAGGNGGGAILDLGHGSYLDSTLSDNSLHVMASGTQNGGGAIDTAGGALVGATTIAGNLANAPGGAVLSAGPINAESTILAGNTASPVGNCAGAGPFNSSGFNLESGDTCALHATGDLVNTDPHLGPLQNNGGTTLTRALPAGSPAVDAGSCDIFGNTVPVDQRLVVRPQPAGGRCDIGAYELVAPLVSLPFLACYDPGTSGCVDPFAPSAGARAEVTAITADGRHLYVAGPHVVYHYSRNPFSGALTLHDCIDEGNADQADCATHFPGNQLPLQVVNAIALSPDPGQPDLYVAGSGDGSTGDRAIVHLHRDPNTGALSFGECIAAVAGTTCANSFGTSTDGRAAMTDLKVSPDGASVLAASRTFGAELLNLDRNQSTGTLTMRQCFTFSNGSPAANCTNVTSSPTACSTNPIDMNGVAISPDNSDVYVAAGQCDVGAMLHFTRAGDHDLNYRNCIGDPSSGCALTQSGDAFGSPTSIAVSPDGEVYLGVGSGGAAKSAAIVHLRRVMTAGATHGDLSFGNCLSAAGNGCGAWLSGAPGGNSAVLLVGFSSDSASIYATTPGYNAAGVPGPLNAGVLRFARDTSSTATHGDVTALTNCFASNNAAASYPPCAHPPASVTADIGPGASGGALSPDDRQLYVPTDSGWGGLIQLGVVSPSASTAAATNVTQTSAVLNASANPNGVTTTYHFEYGTTRSYGLSKPLPDAPVGADSADHAESQTISGLTPGTTYHFRIVATSATATTFGDDQTFSTAPATPGSGGGSGPPPAPPAPAPSPPAATSGQSAATSSTGAGFSGSVNPEGQATTVFFQYGIDSRYRPGGGTTVIYDQSTAAQSLPADNTPHAVSATTTGLVPNAVYHVRLVATNATGTTFGPDQTFTTPAGPAPPPPVLGQTVNAKPVSGQVFVLLAGRLVPLTQGQQLPSGSVVDARAGSLQLTAASGAAHQTQNGVFGGAIFKLTQARAGAGRGLTTLSLVEGAFPGAPTYATCKAHRTGDPTASAASSTLQLLHASAHGKFRTSGRYSAATVRGTKWTISDRCDGTLTHDITDSVAVTDFVRHKAIVLHAGQSYLAKAQATHKHK